MLILCSSRLSYTFVSHANLEGTAGKAGCDNRYHMSTSFGGDQSVGCAAVLSLSVHSLPFVCAANEADVHCDCLACNAGCVTAELRIL